MKPNTKKAGRPKKESVAFAATVAPEGQEPITTVRTGYSRWESTSAPEQTRTHGDLTPAFVRWFFENDEAGAREYYADRIGCVEVREAMEALGLQ